MATKRTSDGSDGGISKRLKYQAPDMAEQLTRHLRSDYNATITVLVGPGEARFTVHQDLICRNSEFFAKACSGDWKEARERIVWLPTDARLFQMYVEGLYCPNTNIYANMVDTLRSTAEPADQVYKHDVVHELCRLWVLVDFLQNTPFQDGVIVSLRKHANNEPPSGPTIEWIVSNTSTNSPLREWLIDVLRPHLNSSDYAAELLDELTGNLPADFLMALLKSTTAILPERFEAPAPRRYA
ncbi:hypothetical protein LTR12_012995 [Friedmanniomyces endolithicus]|nr:hypothetical protein LTR74_014326 [Friedmanniomyces endolithicus]KAK1812641.1 hypothetical protein LTR12_012995 [Friedmanniomyces endolithicus]